MVNHSFPGNNGIPDYNAVGYHRGSIRQGDEKSKWTISPMEEYGLFESCYSKSYYIADKGWEFSDVHIGKCPVDNSSLNSKLAEFVASPSGSEWHGYPILIGKKKESIPHLKVLNSWKDENRITKADLKRIRGAKLCKKFR